MLYAYFDESETKVVHPVSCMSGIVFDMSASQHVDRKQKDYYETYQIPEYHAAVCAAGDPPFSHLDWELRDNLRRQLAELIIDNAEFAVGEAVGVNEFNSTIGIVRPDLSAYDFCLHSCIGGVRFWADSINYQGPIAYIFEAGSKHQGHADRLFSYVMAHVKHRLDYRYASHTFASKRSHRPLHLADLAAWEFSNSMEGLYIGRDSAPGYVRMAREMQSSFMFHDIDDLKRLATPMAKVGWGIPRIR